MLGTEQGAEDVVQDATLRAWQAVRTVDPDRGFRSWFLRIVANCARNDRRSRGRRSTLTLRAAAQPAMPVPTPEQSAITDADHVMVVSALNRLSATDRLVIALRHFEQLNEAEMADVLAKPIGTVKSRLSRAMGRLRQQVDGGGRRG